MMAESRNIFATGSQPSNGSPTNINNDTSASSESSLKAKFSNNADLTQVTAKIESLKKWTVNTYKTTKHTINEQLGKVKRTVDKDLEDRIEALRELQRRYQEVLAFSRGYTHHFLQANNLQKSLSEAIYQLSCKEDVLNSEFVAHSEALNGVSQNGEIFVRSLNNFISSLETLTDKTIDDTLLTIDQHDQARLEYDVYRCELENLKNNPNASVLVAETESQCELQKQKYEQLKEDIRVKLTLLEENRFKVMRRQISLIQNAFFAYFSNSENALNSAIGELKSGTENSSLHDNDPMQPSDLQSNKFDLDTLHYGDNHPSSFLEK